MPRGIPKTKAQRTATHKRIHGNSDVPKIRRGKNRR